MAHHVASVTEEQNESVELDIHGNNSQVLAKPERQTISYSRLFLEALTFSRVTRLFARSPPEAYINIHSITILFHRATARV